MKYHQLPTASDLCYLSAEYAMDYIHERAPFTLHFHPDLIEVAQAIQVIARSERHIEIDLLIDYELAPYEWYIVQAMGSKGP